jgi:hypothetical protein
LQESLADLLGRAGVLFKEVLKRLEVKLGIGARARPSVAASPSIMGKSRGAAVVAEWFSMPALAAGGSDCGWGAVLSEASGGAMTSSADAAARELASGLAGV